MQNERDLFNKTFERYGLEDYAYIRKTVEKGETFYTIYAADGTALVDLPHFEAARAAIRQCNLTAMSLH